MVIRRARVADPKKGDRGLRLPPQQAGIKATRDRLYPWMLAPVLPNERLAGGRFTGRFLLERMVQPINAPDGVAEIGVWYVPMSALPDWMTRWAVVADIEDVTTSGNQTVGLEGDDSVSSESITDEGLHHRNRTWAGEIGSTTAGLSSRLSRYMPYASNSAYAIAQNWYEMEIDEEVASAGNEQVEDYGQSPPKVAEVIRGALPSGVDGDTAGVVSTSDHLGEWIQRISLMTRVDQTYADYLAAHGTNPRILGGIPQPIGWTRSRLKPILSGNTGITGTAANASFSDNQQAASVDLTGVSNSLDEIVASTSQFVYADDGGLAPYGAEFSLTLPSMELPEPGFIVGTMVWHKAQLQRGEFAEHLTANHMLRFPHGGVGGYDELDFVVAKQIYGYNVDDPTDTDIDEDAVGPPVFAVDNEGRGSTRIINMLNLFFNGDSFTNRARDLTFDFRTLGGQELDPALQELNMQCFGELAIASHLVSVA